MGVLLGPGVVDSWSFDMGKFEIGVGWLESLLGSLGSDSVGLAYVLMDALRWMSR